MIRQANRFDKDAVIEMMLAFRDESPMAEILQNDDPEHYHRLLDNILAGQGVIFLAEGAGLVMAMVAPSVWNAKVLVLHELAWYVVPEKRDGTVGARLLKAYIDYAKALKEQGRIRYFTVTKMVTSPDFNYEKLGFRKVDENWIQ